MNYSPEQLTDSLLETLLPRVDPERTGTFVEIGCGTGNFSFVMARRLGYKALAVEPLVYESLMEECCLGDDEDHVPLEIAAITEHDGVGPLWLHSGGDSNFASLLPSWNMTQSVLHVRCLTLATLLKIHCVRTISCLKIDVEGAENIILRQLKDLPAELLPKIVVFEYGGGGNRSEGKGGWTAGHFKNTEHCLDLMIELRYSLVQRFDSNCGPSTPNFQLFPPEAHYGNLIFVKE